MTKTTVTITITNIPEDKLNASWNAFLDSAGKFSIPPDNLKRDDNMVIDFEEMSRKRFVDMMAMSICECVSQKFTSREIEAIFFTTTKSEK